MKLASISSIIGNMDDTEIEAWEGRLRAAEPVLKEIVKLLELKVAANDKAMKLSSVMQVSNPEFALLGLQAEKDALNYLLELIK